MEELRKQKDRMISELTVELEKQRTTYEILINQKSQTIEMHEVTIWSKSQEILSLKETITQKFDVESQLEECLLREAEN
jgi:hypothetical protein